EGRAGGDRENTRRPGGGGRGRDFGLARDVGGLQARRTRRPYLALARVDPARRSRPATERVAADAGVKLLREGISCLLPRPRRRMPRKRLPMRSRRFCSARRPW